MKEKNSSHIHEGMLWKLAILINVLLSMKLQKHHLRLKDAASKKKGYSLFSFNHSKGKITNLIMISSGCSRNGNNLSQWLEKLPVLELTWLWKLP